MNQLSPVPASNGLRHRLVEDMTVRGFSDKTRKHYIRIVSGLAAFLGCNAAIRMVCRIASSRNAPEPRLDCLTRMLPVAPSWLPVPTRSDARRGACQSGYRALLVTTPFDPTVVSAAPELAWWCFDRG